MADFYDIHTHIMDLSHPNYILFIKRLGLEKYLFSLYIPIISNIISAIFASKSKRILNLLSLMDNDISDLIKIAEIKDIKPFLKNLIIDDVSFDGIVITPLLMDFGQKYSSDFDNEVWYNSTPHKAIKNQVIDVFLGIAEYVRTGFDGKLKIFPFLGLNTRNYSLKSDLNREGNIKSVGIIDLLDKYFKDFTLEEKEKREKKLLENMGNFESIDKLSCYSFAGIKVYPPLGFDPWPDNEEEREKVKYLYNYCEKKAIPITTHCGVGGFQTVDKNTCYILASPLRWKKVFENYPNLKVNFAHFATSLKEWRKEILKLIVEYENVYTDIAYVCFKERDYEVLESEIKKLCGKGELLEKFYSRLLFGSDFIINLLDCTSYYEYLANFKNTRFFKGKKVLLCYENPRKFLFG